MFGLQAMLVASAVFATTISQSPVAGTLASVGATASGATLTVDRGDAGPATVSIPSDAVIRERVIGSDWQPVSLLALKVEEPVTVLFDASGHVREVDAEYALVTTRAVIVQHGYLVGTDGVARKLVAAAAAVTTMPLGAYVELRTNPVTGDAFDAAVSSHPFAGSAHAAPAVTVTFEVRVPANTPSSSTIYLATNAQNWTANAIRLTPEPGNRWTATVNLAGGTVLQYKYTRGSWSTGERDPAGAEIQNRTLTVTSTAKAQGVEDVVARWADLPS
jgi:hypothetical protein